MQPNPNTGGMPDPAKLEVHPAAELFPMMEAAEFQELVDDIRVNGLRTPILRDRDGLVLDGRHRMLACPLAGVEPRFETWDGQGSPWEVVVSLNLRRRHLNESQRALLAAQIKERMAEEAGANWHYQELIENTGRLFNISPRSIKRAAKVLRSGDQKLFLLIQSGEMTVSAAAEKLEQQPAPEPAATAAAEGPIRFPILHAEPRWERQKIEKLAALAVSEVAAEDAVLFVRTPDHALADAIQLLERWEFHYEASIVVRRRARAGRYTRLQHDLVLIAARGRPPAPSLTPASMAPGRPGLGEIIEAMFPGLPQADALAARARRSR